MWHLTGLGEQHDVSALGVREAASRLSHMLAEIGEFGGGATGTLAILHAHLLQQAQMAAYQDTFLLLCATTLLALLPAMLSRERPQIFGKQSKGVG